MTIPVVLDTDIGSDMDDSWAVAMLLGCLEGSLHDQAALIGILQGLYDLGLPLLLVECVDGDDEGRVDAIR